jgi:hypothetical protein
MSNNKQTPMQELIERLERIKNKIPQTLISEKSFVVGINRCISEAKLLLDKEKEVIEKAWLNGVDYRDAKGHASTYLEIELGEHLDRTYYNETYGGNNEQQ